MQTTTAASRGATKTPASLHSVDAIRAATKQTSYPPLELVTRPTVGTPDAAYYLNRKQQTLRDWASNETFPAGLRPVRINGRLAWPVAGIRAALGV